MISVAVALPEHGGSVIRVVTIRRIVGGTDMNSMNQYVVTIEGESIEATFHHRYGDGWMLCVSRALQALDEVRPR